MVDFNKRAGVDNLILLLTSDVNRFGINGITRLMCTDSSLLHVISERLQATFVLHE